MAANADRERYRLQLFTKARPDGKPDLTKPNTQFGFAAKSYQDGRW